MQTSINIAGAEAFLHFIRELNMQTVLDPDCHVRERMNFERGIYNADGNFMDDRWELFLKVRELAMFIFPASKLDCEVKYPWIG